MEKKIQEYLLDISENNVKNICKLISIQNSSWLKYNFIQTRETERFILLFPNLYVCQQRYSAYRSVVPSMPHRYKSWPLLFSECRITHPVPLRLNCKHTSVEEAVSQTSQTKNIKSTSVGEHRVRTHISYAVWTDEVRSWIKCNVE